MTDTNIEVRLKGLQDTFSNLKSLLAQRQKEIKHGRATAPASHNSIDNNIRNEHMMFLMQAAEIHYILNHKDVFQMMNKKRKCIEQQLRKIEAEIQQLNASQDFVKV